MIYNDGLKNKRSANSLHLSWEFRADFNVNRAAKEHAGEGQKSPQKAKITSKKQKVLKCVAFLAGAEDRLHVNRTEKNTLVLINVLRIQPYSLITHRIKFNLQRKR